MEEIWKIIPDTNEKYSVSNLGRIRRNEHYTNVRPNKYCPKGRVKYYEERILDPYINKDGYSIVTLLVTEGKAITKTVHIFVALAFIDNPNNFPCVNHKNEIRDDNRADNLEWCTVEYNNRYGTRSEKIRKSSGKKVAQYDLQGNLIKIWPSISSAMRYFGCEGNSGISRVCRGLPGRKTYKGFIWKYVDDNVISKKHAVNYLISNLDKNELLEVILLLLNVLNNKGKQS